MTGGRPHASPGPSATRIVSLGCVDIACVDGGGSGEPVVLMHSAWGSPAHWTPQLPALADAGYRPIAWARRGHRGSGSGPTDAPGTAADDLDALIEALGLDRFHLVGTALGAFGAVDYALCHPDRLLSLTAAASLCGITDNDFVEETARLVPAAWEALPIGVRELSAAYRLENPEGAARWTQLTDQAVVQRVHQPAKNTVTREAMSHLALPVLFLTGDADPYMPPPRMAALASHVPDARFALIQGAGHSPAWENPAEFNRRLLQHLARGGAS